MGRGALGMGGLAGGFETPGLEATGGGLGLFATGGAGLFAKELEGREDAGELSAVAALAVLFQGAADPLEDAIPGKTAIGFAEASAVTDDGLETGVGTGRVLGGGAGAATGAALGGTSSR